MQERGRVGERAGERERNWGGCESEQRETRPLGLREGQNKFTRGGGTGLNGLNGRNMNSCARLAAVRPGQRQAALTAEGLDMNSCAPLFARCNHIVHGFLNMKMSSHL